MDLFFCAEWEKLRDLSQSYEKKQKSKKNICFFERKMVAVLYIL